MSDATPGTTSATSTFATDKAKATHDELVHIARANPDAVEHIIKELNKQGLTLTADFRIVEVKKPLFSRSDAKDAAEDGEEAAERALANIKAGLHTFGERATLYTVDLPKEAIANRKASFVINHERRMAKWEQRRAERKVAKARERAEVQKERARREAQEAQEAAAKAAERVAEAEAAERALEGETTPI